MAKQFKPGSPGGPTSGKAKQINVQDLTDHIENVIIPNIKKNFQITEDAEFEVISSKVNDPEGSTLTEIQDVDYGWQTGKVFFEEAAAIEQDVYDQTLKKLKSFPVYVGMDFSKGPDNLGIAEKTEA